MPTSALRVTRTRTAMTAACAATLVLSSCSDSDDTSNEGSVTLENCGQEASYDAPYDRIAATSNNSNVGTLMKIGAVDTLVAASVSEGNTELMTELYGPGLEDVPRTTSDTSEEQILGWDPQLVIGSYSGLWSGSAGVTREGLEEYDIATYVISDSCRQEPDNEDSALGTMGPWEALRADIENYGVLTGNEDEADAALAELEERLAALEEAPTADEAPSILLFDSGETDVYTSGSNGAPQGIMDVAGATNVFEDEDTTWFRASWEQVASREPDVIVVLDYNSDTADEVEQKVATVRTQAALVNSEAVQQNRIVVLPLMMFTSGYPNIEAAEQLRVALEGLGLLPESGITPTIELSTAPPA